MRKSMDYISDGLIWGMERIEARRELKRMVKYLKEVLDLSPEIVKAFKIVDRRHFVGPNHHGQEIYDPNPLGVGYQQAISQPLAVAFMLKHLEVESGQQVLDVGTGSGWQAALLAFLTGKKGKVISVERIKELCQFAENNLKKYPELKSRIELIYGNAITDLEPEQNFDRIISAAAAKDQIPSVWVKHLNPGGRIVAPVGKELWVAEKKSDGDLVITKHPHFHFVPLVED